MSSRKKFRLLILAIAKAPENEEKTILKSFMTFYEIQNTGNYPLFDCCMVPCTSALSLEMQYCYMQIQFGVSTVYSHSSIETLVE